MTSVGADEERNLISKPLDRRRSGTEMEDGDSGDTCRICRGEPSTEQPLFHPCKCSGSIRYVHQECLMEWLSHSQKKYCELCKTPFRFTKLYDQSMPDVLPVPLFLRQLALHGAKTCGRWVRYAIVVFVWSCCLPWAIRHIWRGLFWLSDGTSMDEQDVLQLLSNNTSVSVQDMVGNASVLALDPSLQTVSRPPLPSLSFLVSFLTGDALLRGLLRLIASNAFTISPLTTNINGTSASGFLQPQTPRHPSLLSETQSLNSFTRYPGVNNTLIDILEGQLICLCVIATFILVFLIREWVINQQPVHLMPDPDQGDGGQMQRQQHEDARHPAQRARPHIPRVGAADGQPDRRALDIAQRPRAVPRQRRVAVTERATQVPSNEELVEDLQLPERSSSLQYRGSSTNLTGASSEPAAVSPTQDAHDSVQSSLNVHSPPLERGVLDDAVSIRRTIEEHRSFVPAEQVENAPLEHDDDRHRTSISPPPSSTNNLHKSEFDFAALANRNDSREFTFISSSNLDQSSSSSARTSIDQQSSSIADDHDEGKSNGSAGDVASVRSLSVTSSSNEMERVGQGTDTPETEATVESIDSPEVVEEEGAVASIPEKIAIWLWHIEDAAHVPAVLDGPDVRDLPPAEHAPVVQAQRAVPVPVRPQGPVPVPVQEPNLQFGIDLNDPNAVEEAEELEGILELIGMEGPIAGMIQNLIFSVFLISLTLTISVWCPYIWGQVALSIVTHPIAICVTAPLTLLSRTANVLLDLSLLLIGMLGIVLTNMARAGKYMVAAPLPSLGNLIKVNAAESLAVKITQSSSIRLEKAFTVTLFSMRPKFPTYAMMTLHTLRTLKSAAFDVGRVISNDVLDTWLHAHGLWKSLGLISIPIFVFRELTAFPFAAVEATKQICVWVVRLSNDMVMTRDASDIDFSLMEPSTQDIILTTIIGYGFFALSGSAYLKLARLFLGLRGEEKVEGFFADSFRQAGGVMKVIFIIGLEMLFFPLYCGCLLDMALLPLFKNATLASRWQFVTHAPITGFFVHWFVGTCYMFHFALFVSMCRKIMRTGVLYFIRDPDDPTFHPVRDVLERPVFTQLGKIAFSACVYGGLLLVCLGGVIWTIASVSGIFPIQWVTDEPRLAFPLDVFFFNFLVPFVIRTAEPSKKISAMYSWWFKKCARQLRLSHFLFGEDRGEERKGYSWLRVKFRLSWTTGNRTAPEVTSGTPSENHRFDGSWVRAPASDTVRIPKGTRVFLQVDKDNNRLDGQYERSKGLHGKDDDRFAKIFIPSHFRARIAAFIFLVWLFTAVTGACVTLGPLLVGRAFLYIIAGSNFAPNDLYAFSIGIHISGALYLLGSQLKKHNTLSQANWTSLGSDLKATSLRLLERIRYVVGMLYLAIAFGLVIPMLLSLLAELYVHMPAYEFLMTFTKQYPPSIPASADASDAIEAPTIHLVQSWTLGILILRLLLQVSLRHPNPQTRLANAVRAIIRRGPLQPDVRLASRALVLPLILSSIILLVFPIYLSHVYMIIARVPENMKLTVYRGSYPMLLLVMSSGYAVHSFWYKLASWQVKIRDEVYLVGERLHNFTDSESKKVQLSDTKQDKGKEREKQTVEDMTQSIPSADLSTGVGSGTDLHHHRDGFDIDASSVVDEVE